MTDERSSWETPLIFNDQPLQPARERTYFQFENYARTFARLIASADTRTPLTIGINGDWGSGKTTLMRAIQVQLDQSTQRKERPAFIAAGEEWPDDDHFRPVRTVWFNAWKYSRQDALFVALVEEVLREMRRDGTLSRIYASLSDPKSVRLRVPEAVLNTVSQVFTMGQVDLDLSRFESESRFKTNLAFLDEFMAVFDRLVRRWVYKDLKEGDAEERETDDRRGALAIFIDDLDRCLPEKTVQVLESIKLMMDCPGIVFVIGASRRIVQAAVKTHYRAFDELQGESARYLDKIIQVPFNLPPLQPLPDREPAPADPGRRDEPAAHQDLRQLRRAPVGAAGQRPARVHRGRAGPRALQPLDGAHRGRRRALPRLVGAAPAPRAPGPRAGGHRLRPTRPGGAGRGRGGGGRRLSARPQPAGHDRRQPAPARRAGAVRSFRYRPRRAASLHPPLRAPGGGGGARGDAPARPRGRGAHLGGGRRGGV
jgi:hypothetical protein